MVSSRHDQQLGVFYVASEQSRIRDGAGALFVPPLSPKLARW